MVIHRLCEYTHIRSSQTTCILKYFKGVVLDPPSSPEMSFVWKRPQLTTVLTLCSHPPPTGEGDEDDVRLGAVPWPGGAQPQRSLETPGHLRLQHGAGSVGGDWGEGHPQTVKEGRDARMWLEHLRSASRTRTHAHTRTHIYIWAQGAPMSLCHARDCRRILIFPIDQRIYVHTAFSPLWHEDINRLPVLHPSVGNCASTDIRVCRVCTGPLCVSGCIASWEGWNQPFQQPLK